MTPLAVGCVQIAATEEETVYADDIEEARMSGNWTRMATHCHRNYECRQPVVLVHSKIVIQFNQKVDSL